eukprot:scaffold37488_cov49-Attheya_sp.AAC.4
MKWTVACVFTLLGVMARAFIVPSHSTMRDTRTCVAAEPCLDRRSAFASLVGGTFSVIIAGNSRSANAAAVDCMSDCVKNCKLVAPKDPAYCKDTCQDYCSQTDRTDGLSGSVSSEGGEMGILGRSTAVKGEDKPPGIKIPGLDFSSGKGKKLIGY